MDFVGQLLGWVAALLTFLSYQCKEHKKLLVIQTLSVVCICISYLFLDALSGMLLNVICLIRNFIIFKKNLKIFSYSFWPYALAAVIGIVGALSWQGPMTLVIIAALMINTVFMYFPNVQNLRKSILLTSTLVIIYNVYYHVWGGIANEIIAITSAAIGIYRYRKEK